MWDQDPYGDVIVYGSGGVVKKFPYVSHPSAFRQEIRHAISGTGAGEVE